MEILIDLDYKSILGQFRRELLKKLYSLLPNKGDEVDIDHTKTTYPHIIEKIHRDDRNNLKYRGHRHRDCNVSEFFIDIESLKVDDLCDLISLLEGEPPYEIRVKFKWAK